MLNFPISGFGNISFSFIRTSRAILQLAPFVLVISACSESPEQAQVEQNLQAETGLSQQAGVDQGRQEAADLILSGGQIRTDYGWVEAMAIKDGVITALGDTADVNGYQAAATEVIDLDGATVLPGLHDMHVHPMGAGMLQSQCTFPQGSPPGVVLDTIRQCADEKAPGEWISGGQWDAASFGDTPPHRSMLDEVAPDNPVSLIDISVHSMWLNSRALELAGPGRRHHRT